MEKIQNITKEDILYSINDYSIEQLCDYILSGVVSIDEIQKIPTFDRKKRESLKCRLEQMKDQSQVNSQENLDWQLACEINTVLSYDGYLEKYPDGIYRDEAKERRKKKIDSFPSMPDNSDNDDDKDGGWSQFESSNLEKLLVNLKERCSDKEAADYVETFINSNRDNKNLFIEQLKINPNLISSGAMYILCKERKCFSSKELSPIYSEDFLRAMINKMTSINISEPTNNITIDKQCTEVYFWGISGSGKSCVLASLFSVLGKGSKGTFTATDCNGKGYMDDLKKILKEDTVSALLPGTPVGTTFEMSFDVARKKESHPFTFVDIAGGMLYLMYDYMENKDEFMAEKNKDNRDILEQLKEVVQDKLDTNRKMHFFVLEYGAEKWEKYGKTQDDYLSTSLEYIKKIGVFNKATDGIYIIVTKSDIAKNHNLDVNSAVEKYIKMHYMNFYNNVVQVCKKNNIDFDLIPYSIGMVRMKNLCMFNPKPAEAILDKIIERSFNEDESAWGKIKRFTRK